MTSLRCYAVISALFFGALSDAAVIHIPLSKGAKEAIPHSHPWQVLLTVRIPGGSDVSMCSGAVIPACDNCDGSDLVLTAAHCVTEEVDNGPPTRDIVNPNLAEVFAGLHNMTKRFDDEAVQKVFVKEIALHPGWSADTAWSQDIAILRTNVPFKFDDKVKSVSLPVWGKPIPVGAQCKIAGWGRTGTKSNISDVLLELNATIVDDEACLKYFDQDYQRQLMLCVEASEHGGATACSGDSGGPLVCSDDKAGGPTVYGVVSAMHGVFGCEGDAPALYANVATAAKWIRETSDRITAMKK